MTIPETLSIDHTLYTHCRLDDLPPLPDYPAFAEGSRKLVRLGDIAVCQGGWGYPLSTRQLIDHFAQHGHDPAEVAEAMGGTGFNSGYYYPLTCNIFSDKVQDWHVAFAVAMTQQVAEARGWDGIDVLILGSSTTHRDSLSQVVAELARIGLPVGESQIYVQACNSALAGINDLCRNEAYHGTRAVVIGMESLFGGDVANLDSPTVVRIFGNGGGAVAFIPGVEIKHITGRTVAEYDVQGVITGPQSCPVATITERVDPPHWYEEVGDYTAGKLVAAPDGIFIEIPPSEDGRLQMNGMSTLAYFAKRVPPLALDVLTTYQAQYAEELGSLGVPLSHQPSRPVVTFINQDLLRLQLEAAGVEGREARRYARRASDEELAALMRSLSMSDRDLIQIPWLMDKTGYNNVSAGTSVVALVKMIEDSLIQPGTPVPVFGFGIGSVIQADVWQFSVD